MAEPGLAVASLRAKAAHRFDPVRFHYLETLTRRALQHQGEVRRILDGKLFAALAAYRQRFDLAQNDAEALIARITAQHPAAADELQQLFIAGDFSGVSRYATGLEKNQHGTSLAELARHVAQHPPAGLDGSIDGTFGSRAELKTIRYFRKTWSKLSVDKQLAQAIEQAPENAGPINSHMLVLRSLALMRDIAPDYLHRFMSYADTLLWLEQADKKDKPAIKKPLAARAKRK